MISTAIQKFSVSPKIPITISLVGAIAGLLGCSGGDESAPQPETSTEQVSPATTSQAPAPTSGAPTQKETKEEKNARMAKLYGSGEKKKADTAQAERAAHAEAELSKFTFQWNEAPSFRRAGGNAILNLDALNYVTQNRNYKTPAFTKTGSLSFTKSATLELIRKAYAEKDWLTLINIGGQSTYSSYPSTSRIDAAIHDLRVGAELRVGVDPYQLHIYYPGPPRSLNYIAISHSGRLGCKTLSRGGANKSHNQLTHVPGTQEFVLRFNPGDMAPTLVAGTENLHTEGILHQLNLQQVEACNQIKRRLKTKEIEEPELERLLAEQNEKLKQAFLAWVKNN
jgi:hypothetical protein